MPRPSEFRREQFGQLAAEGEYIPLLRERLQIRHRRTPKRFHPLFDRGTRLANALRCTDRYGNRLFALQGLRKFECGCSGCCAFLPDKFQQLVEMGAEADGFVRFGDRLGIE